MVKTHIGVYGVITKKDCVLVVKKSRGPYKGLYDLPGGCIEAGETHEQALIREIKEETGITPLKRTFIDTMTYRCSFSQIDFNHIGHIFMIDEFDESHLNVYISLEDVDGCQWWPMTDLDRLTPFAKTICAQFSSPNSINSSRMS